MNTFPFSLDRLTSFLLTEQETLIASLAERNTQRNAQFRRLLFLVPLIAAIPYIFALLRLPTPLLSLLALTSLASTAYLLHCLPPGSTGVATLDNLGRSAPASPPPGLIRPSPLEAWLPFLNMGMCAVLVVAGLISGAREGGAEPWAGVLGLGNLPTFVYAVVLAAKMVMASVDPERELSGLKYQYKGA